MPRKPRSPALLRTFICLGPGPSLWSGLPMSSTACEWEWWPQPAEKWPASSARHTTVAGKNSCSVASNTTSGPAKPINERRFFGQQRDVHSRGIKLPPGKRPALSRLRTASNSPEPITQLGCTDSSAAYLGHWMDSPPMTKPLGRNAHCVVRHKPLRSTRFNSCFPSPIVYAPAS